MYTLIVQGVCGMSHTCNVVIDQSQRSDSQTFGACVHSQCHLLVSCCFVAVEQDMERKVQEHKQELERLQQATKLDKQKLIHEAKLKKEASTVS